MIQRFNILWLFSFIWFLLSIEEVQSQAIIGAKSAAIGNATTALYEDQWGLFSNPASISSEKISVGFFGLRYFGFPEITDVSSVINFPLLNGSSSIGFYSFGDDLYSETNINVGYKYSWKGVNAGLSIQYRHLSLGGDYGSGGALSLSIGILSKINKSIFIGAKIRNVNRGVYNFEFNDEELPQDISIGLSYKLEDKSTFYFDVLKDLRFPVSYRGGVEVEIIDDIVGRLGATFEPTTYTFGLGYRLKKWQINIAVQQHEVLGTSPGFDILVNL